MTTKPFKPYNLFLLALLAFSGFGGQAAIARAVLEKPVYNPGTKSYFELIEDRITNGTQGPGWDGARKFAEKRYFKGVQGRLAIIPSAETEMFIKTTLRPSQNMWFGLYYDCETRNLKWVSGDAFHKGSYANWDPVNWNLGSGGLFCPGNSGIMPALISDSKYWALQLLGKHYYQYLVEYPTGGVEPVKTTPKPAEPAPAVTEADHGPQNEE